MERGEPTQVNSPPPKVTQVTSMDSLLPEVTQINVMTLFVQGLTKIELAKKRACHYQQAINYHVHVSLHLFNS